MDATDDRDWRYQQIMARLQKRQVRAPANSATDELAAALDAVGAMHLLEARGRGAIWGWYGYGPKVAREASNWVGVVGWWRRSSFYAYERLKLLGIWALRAKDEGERCVIILGERELAFRGAFHNPESLHRQLRRDFRAYYVGESSPPATPLLSLPYEARQRLAARLRLEAAIDEWAAALAAQASIQ